MCFPLWFDHGAFYFPYHLETSSCSKWQAVHLRNSSLQCPWQMGSLQRTVALVTSVTARCEEARPCAPLSLCIELKCASLKPLRSALWRSPGSPPSSGCGPPAADFCRVCPQAALQTLPLLALPEVCCQGFPLGNSTSCFPNCFGVFGEILIVISLKKREKLNMGRLDSVAK